MSYIGNTNTTQAFTPAVDYFNGTGSQTVFTLSRPVASVAQIQVTVNNVPQKPSTAFTVNGNTLTFTGAPSSGTNNVYVYYTSPITQVIQPGQGTVMPTSLATDGTFQFPSISYTGTLTGNGGIVNIGSGQIYKDASGNLGIGTSSPSQILEVSKSQNGETQIKVVNTNTGSSARAALVLGNNTSSSAGGLLLNGSATTSLGGANSLNIYQGLTAPITFFTDGSERARIDSSGNLLVGTTSLPSASVAGWAANVATAPGYTISSRNTTAVAGQYGFYNPNGLVGAINTSGSSTSFVTSSDYRLKENITPMTGALSVVEQLKPCTYTWKADGSDGQGFIAHELAEVVPDCVSGEKDAVEIVDVKDEEGNVIGTEEKPVYQGIDTSFLVATLTAAIQEQQAIIQSQAADIAALKAKVGL